MPELSDINILQEDWGELNTGKQVPHLYVLELGTENVVTLRGLPPNSSCGQPIWTPDGSGKPRCLFSLADLW